MRYLPFFILLFMQFHANAIDKMPIAKQDWLKQMHDLLPAEICKKDTIFRQCYTTTTQECFSVFNQAFASCSNELSSKISATIDSYENSEDLGGTLGSCVSLMYVDIMEQRNIRNSTCDKHFKQKTLIQRMYGIEPIIGFAGFVLLMLSINYSKRTKKKIYKFSIVTVGFLLAMVAIIIISEFVDSNSKELNYYSAKFFGFFIFLYLIYVAKNKSKKKEPEKPIQ